MDARLAFMREHVRILCTAFLFIGISGMHLASPDVSDEAATRMLSAFVSFGITMEVLIHTPLFAQWVRDPTKTLPFADVYVHLCYTQLVLVCLIRFMQYETTLVYLPPGYEAPSPLAYMDMSDILQAVMEILFCSLVACLSYFMPWMCHIDQCARHAVRAVIIFFYLIVVLNGANAPTVYGLSNMRIAFVVLSSVATYTAVALRRASGPQGDISKWDSASPLAKGLLAHAGGGGDKGEMWSG